MAALDTNVLLRYLVRDHDSQHSAAKKLVEASLKSGETLFIPITVILEMEWVLRSRFEFTKDQISTTIADLLAAAELSIDSELAVEIALNLYKKNAADFADCVHIALSHVAGQKPFWTFDRTAAKIKDAKLLS